MSLIAKATEREMPPLGQHIVRCYGVVDIGYQYSEQFKKSQEQVIILFELPNSLMKDGRPFSYNAWFNNNIGEKTKLGLMLEAWRGRKFTETESKGFQLTNLVNVPAFITLGLKEDGKKIKHISIIGLPKGLECPPLVNKKCIFDRGNHTDFEFESLPDWIKAKVNLREPGDTAPPASESAQKLQDEDIPF